MTFKQDELFTATEVVRNFSTILEKVSKNKGKNKIVIIKNNKPQALLISLEEYEKLSKALALLESIYQNKELK